METPGLSHLRHRKFSPLREAQQSLEMWTTGKFSAEVLSRLEEEKGRRTKCPIDWKDGRAVLDVVRGAKEKAIGLALENHFLKHPLSGV